MPVPVATHPHRSRGSASNEKVDLEIKIKAGCKICTVWTGVLEIVTRLAFTGLSGGCLVSACFVIHTLRTNPYLDAILVTDNNVSHVRDVQSLIGNTKSTAGFMIFLSIVTVIIEISTVIGLFILKANTSTLSCLRYIDAKVNNVLAIFFLSGAAASAAHCSKWSTPPYLCRNARGLVISDSYYCEEDILTIYLATLSAVGFLGLLTATFLVVWSCTAQCTKRDGVSNLVETSQSAAENGDADNKNQDVKETKA